MKRSEFVPGVLFMLPGYNLTRGGKIFRVEELSATTKLGAARGFSLYATFYGGVLRRHIVDKDFYHTDIKSKGICIWQEVCGVYLESKLVPFSSLTKVDLPATNPQSI